MLRNGSPWSSAALETLVFSDFPDKVQEPCCRLSVRLALWNGLDQRTSALTGGEPPTLCSLNLFGSQRRLYVFTPKLVDTYNIIDSGFKVIVGDANGAVQKYMADATYDKVTVFCSGEQPRNNVGHWRICNVMTSKAVIPSCIQTCSNRKVDRRPMRPPQPLPESALAELATRWKQCKVKPLASERSVSGYAPRWGCLRRQ